MLLYFLGGNVKIREEIKSIVEEANQGDVEIRDFENVDSLIFHVEDNASMVDLIVINSNENDVDQIKLALDLRKNKYRNEIMFLTDNTKLVFESFRVDPISYALVGGEREYIKNAIERAYDKKRKREDEVIILKAGNKSFAIRLMDIRYIEADRRQCVFYYEEDKELKVYKTIGVLEEQLFSKGFFKINRGILVSARYVKSITREVTTLTSGEELNTSRKLYRSARENITKTMSVLEV